MISDDDGETTAYATHPDGPPPAIVISHRYQPRLCAAPDCTLPPHVRWHVSRGGYLYGRHRRTGDALDLCDVHERDVVDLCHADWGDEPRPVPLPEQRDKGAA